MRTRQDVSAEVTLGGHASLEAGLAGEVEEGEAVRFWVHLERVIADYEMHLDHEKGEAS